MKAAMAILGMTTSLVRPPLLDCTAKDVADPKVCSNRTPTGSRPAAQ